MAVVTQSTLRADREAILDRLYGDGQVYLQGYAQGRRDVMVLTRGAYRFLTRRRLVFGLDVDGRVTGTAQGRDLWRWRREPRP